MKQLPQYFQKNVFSDKFFTKLLLTFDDEDGRIAVYIRTLDKSWTLLILKFSENIANSTEMIANPK